MIVGLTGGIGSGKSTVAKIFHHFGIPVYDADAASKKIIDTDATLQKELIDLIGEEVVKEGKIDRPFMASRIFSDETLLKAVNALIHPAVGKHFKRWYASQESLWVLKEAAILFESGSYKECDKIIVVSAPREMRIERVMKRNGVSREDVLARMDKQWDESRKQEMADYLIKNDLSSSVILQVQSIYEDINRQANKGSR